MTFKDLMFMSCRSDSFDCSLKEQSSVGGKVKDSTVYQACLRKNSIVFFYFKSSSRHKKGRALTARTALHLVGLISVSPVVLHS